MFAIDDLKLAFYRTTGDLHIISSALNTILHILLPTRRTWPHRHTHDGIVCPRTLLTFITIIIIIKVHIMIVCIFSPVHQYVILYIGACDLLKRSLFKISWPSVAVCCIYCSMRSTAHSFAFYRITQ